MSHSPTLLRQLMGLHELRCNRVQLKPLEKRAGHVYGNKESLLTKRGLSKPTAYPQLSSPDPGAPLTYFNDGGVRRIFLGSDILAKRDFFGSMIDAGIFLGRENNRGIFLGIGKTTNFH